MKNLQRLLIAAAFASMIPSTSIICSEKPQESMEQIVNKLEESVTKFQAEHQDHTKELDSTIKEFASIADNAEASLQKNQETIRLTVKKQEDELKKILMYAIPAQCGSFGTVAGAAGSHSLKATKRALTKANNLTPETLAQLNKGIRNNRIGMGISLALITLSAAASKINNDLNKKTV